MPARLHLWGERAAARVRDRFFVRFFTGSLPLSSPPFSQACLEEYAALNVWQLDEEHNITFL